MRPVTSLRNVADVSSSDGPRWGRSVLRPWLVDGAVVVLLIASMVLEASLRVRLSSQHPYDLAGVLLIAGMSVPYLAHRRLPMTMLTVELAALLAYSLLHYTAFPGLNAFVMLFGLALHTDRRRSAVAFLATLSVLMVALAVQPAGVTSLSDWISNVLCTAVAWLLGDNWRLRRGRWLSLRERNAALEHQQAEEAHKILVAERLRIARELHDSVAHSMSVIAVQAGMGHHVIDTQPQEAKRALAAIETTSRNALIEMRRLLGVLRQEGEQEAALMPAPGIGDLPTLVAQAHSAGVEVDVQRRGGPRELPPSVDLSAYRIVQEALTNTIRHGGREAQVLLDFGDAQLTIQVHDRGADRAADQASAATPGSGHGLIGMRERVAVFGGQLSAGPRPGGGYGVRATLPLPAAAS
ncbi:MAG: two-component system histidine kinase [Friedmanniella sp.]|nr:two-component system histidine kinase [Friedmanniella sp.]